MTTKTEINLYQWIQTIRDDPDYPNVKYEKYFVNLMDLELFTDVKNYYTIKEQLPYCYPYIIKLCESVKDLESLFKILYKDRKGNNTTLLSLTYPAFISNIFANIISKEPDLQTIANIEKCIVLKESVFTGNNTADENVIQLIVNKILENPDDLESLTLLDHIEMKNVITALSILISDQTCFRKTKELTVEKRLFILNKIIICQAMENKETTIKTAFLLWLLSSKTPIPMDSLQSVTTLVGLPIHKDIITLKEWLSHSKSLLASIAIFLNQKEVCIDNHDQVLDI